MLTNDERDGEVYGETRQHNTLQRIHLYIKGTIIFTLNLFNDQTLFCVYMHYTRSKEQLFDHCGIVWFEFEVELELAGSIVGYKIQFY